MKRIAIISSGYFPVPAVKGGAVETLIDKLIKSNEEVAIFNFEVFSTYDVNADQKSQKYQHTKVNYIKERHLIEQLDKIIYTIVKHVLKSDRQMSFRYIFHRISYIIDVAKKIKKEHYDYVIIENTATLFWTIKLFGNRKKHASHLIYHLHNEVGSTFGCRKVLTNCKAFFCVSEYINSTLIQAYPEITTEKIKVYHNCIDTKQITSMAQSRELLRSNFGYSENDIVLIFVGRLCKDKGIEELLETFMKIEQKNIKMLVVGNFYFGSKLESEFEKHLHDMILTRSDDIKFTGFVPNDKIGEYYQCADIAVLPSVWEEPAGLTIIEAMAAGLPVITTNSGGIPEYVGEGNAIILNKESQNFITELKTSIENLANSSQLRIELSSRAKSRAQGFDYANYAMKLETILEMM